MADRRVPDLSYGQLGESSYDIDDGQWTFSRDATLENIVEIIEPLHPCIPPSMRNPPASTKRNVQILRDQKKWLRKTFPDTVPASLLLTALARDPRNSAPGLSSDGAHLALGIAADIYHMSGSRSVHIVAMAHGEACNVLRLIKPRIEYHTWESKSSVKLQVLDPSASEDGHWLGDGGAIEQIIFASNAQGPCSWLAVRKANHTTILRPIYHYLPGPSPVPRDFRHQYPPSRLRPNPILRLTSERTGGRPHTDVTFNPWYVRQFAIVDEGGYWSIWDVEGQIQKRTPFLARPGKSGHVRDALSEELATKIGPSSNGWNKILWAGGAGTLLVCDRRHLAVFDLKMSLKRLPSPELVARQSSGWILDVKRHPYSLDQVFALTTTRIFLLQINTAGEGMDGDDSGTGAKTLLSCRHFRDEEDITMKLEILSESDVCIAFLYSARNNIVNTYRFSTISGRVTWSCDALALHMDTTAQAAGFSSVIQRLCIVLAPVIQNRLGRTSDVAQEYVERGVKFCQLFSLGINLELSFALGFSRILAPVKGDDEHRGYQMVKPPRVKRGARRGMSTAYVLDDQFIVPDGFDIETVAGVSQLDSTAPSGRDVLVKRRRPVPFTHSTTVNARPLYKLAFYDTGSDGTQSASGFTMAEYIENILRQIRDRKKQEVQGLLTWLELSGFQRFSEDVDEAAAALKKLQDSIEEDLQNAMSDFIVTSLVINQFSIVEESDKSSLSSMYDRLVELWISCLPRKTPGLARLAKEKLARNIAAELCLSSLAVSIRNKSTPLHDPPINQEPFSFDLPVREKSDSTVQFAGSRNFQQMQEPRFLSSPPAASQPATTSAISSPISTKSLLSSNPQPEDNAIARLRLYTTSVKSQPPLGTTRSNILAHWPSIPGSDPALYSWEETRRLIAEGRDNEFDSDEEERRARQRDEQRRRRRTEKFLNRERAKAWEGEGGRLSQPLQETIEAAFAGSQPDTGYQASSSQVVEPELPMTQPMPGLRGSRAGLGRSLKKKKRRKGGF